MSGKGKKGVTAPKEYTAGPADKAILSNLFDKAQKKQIELETIQGMLQEEIARVKEVLKVPDTHSTVDVATWIFKETPKE